MLSRNGYSRAAFALCLAAAVLYNSWPLGFVLDNRTIQNELASSLERSGHPYYWLFMLGDVLTALCLVATTAIVRFKLWPELKSRAWAATCGGLLVFGVFTVVSALVPSKCVVAPAVSCGAGGLGLGLDAFTSVIAALGLLAGLVSLSFQGLRSADMRILVWTTTGVLASWAVIGIAFIVLALSGGDPRLVQYVQLLLSGAAIIAVGLNIKAGAKTVQ